MEVHTTEKTCSGIDSILVSEYFFHIYYITITQTIILLTSFKYTAKYIILEGRGVFLMVNIAKYLPLTVQFLVFRRSSCNDADQQVFRY